jgi:hypothetical protein
MQAIERATFGSLNALWDSHTEKADSNGNLATMEFTVSKCSLQKLTAYVQVPHLGGTGSGGKGVSVMLLIGLHSMWGSQKHFYFVIKINLFTWGTWL